MPPRKSIHGLRSHCSQTFVFAAAFLVLATDPGCSKRIHIEPRGFFDAGSFFLPETKTGKHVFDITNTTSSSVEILGETHLCTCQKISIARCKLQPGQSTPLEMEFSLPNRGTEQTLLCLVKTDHPIYREWPYEVRFRSYLAMELADHVVNLGAQDTSQALSETPVALDIRLYAPANKSTPLIKSIHAPQQLEITKEERMCPTLLQDGFERSDTRLHISVKKENRQFGNYSEPVRLEFDNGHSLVLSINWEIRTLIQAIPANLFFKVDTDPGSLVKTICIRALDNARFKINEVRLVDDRLRLKSERDSIGRESSSHLLHFEFNPAATSDKFASGTVEITTNRLNAAKILVHWAAFKKIVAPGAVRDQTVSFSRKRELTWHQKAGLVHEQNTTP